MDKTMVLKQVLNGKKAGDFLELTAPETLSVSHGNKSITFERVPCLCNYTATEYRTVYQSETANINGDYPCIEIVVNKSGCKRISYKFNMSPLSGCKVW